MIVLVNPNAAGGLARRRWTAVRSQVASPASTTRTYIVESPERVRDLVARELARGETEFVAAGGDGTVNGTLNAILGATDARTRAGIRLGAVGLGSSNDFHKPLGRREKIAGVPISLRFEEAEPRDVGRVTILDHGVSHQRHFLVSASVGFAARANSHFTRSGMPMRLLKRASTRASIYAVALRALLPWRNLPVRLRFDQEPEARLALTNLSVLLSPHIGGDWRCGDGPRADQFRIHLCRSLGRLGLLRVMRDLRHGRATRDPRVSVRSATRVRVDAIRPIDVELDGEVLRGRTVQFDVVCEALRVCP